MAGPTRQDLLEAAGKQLTDVMAANLTVLFCGINPGLYSAAVGHNFARPGNRFWPVMFKAGFTPRLFTPFEERDLLNYNCGITNIVDRATARADELAKKELISGGKELAKKVNRYKPLYLAVVGLTAYRTAFASPKAGIGLQDMTIGETLIWVLPNPSGLNAHHQLEELVRHFKRLRFHAFAGDQ